MFMQSPLRWKCSSRVYTQSQEKPIEMNVSLMKYRLLIHYQPEAYQPSVHLLCYSLLVLCLNEKSSKVEMRNESFLGD